MIEKPKLSNRTIRKVDARGHYERISKYWIGVGKFGGVSDFFIAPLSESDKKIMESEQEKKIFFFELYVPGARGNDPHFLKFAFAYQEQATKKITWLINSTAPIENLIKSIYSKSNLISTSTKIASALIMPLAIPYILERHKLNHLNKPELPSMSEMNQYVASCI